MPNLKDPPVAVVSAEGQLSSLPAAHLPARRETHWSFLRPARVVGADLRRLGACALLFTLAYYSVDTTARSLLAAHGTDVPDDDTLPTGGDLIARYLTPLAALPEMTAVIRTGTRVTAISRLGMDKVVSKDRETRPFTLPSLAAAHGPRRLLARAVIDASGTWSRPNPLGAHGLPAEGEVELAEYIAYGIPDVSG